MTANVTSRAQEIRNLLAVVIDSIDYIGDGPNRACAPTEMIAAILPREILLEAKKLLQETRKTAGHLLITNTGADN